MPGVASGEERRDRHTNVAVRMMRVTVAASCMMSI
jgi:hypothetical protein